MRDKELDLHPLTLWNIPDEPLYFYEEMGGLYTHMFIEDVTTDIAPYGSYSSRNKKSFEIIVDTTDKNMGSRDATTIGKY